MRDADYRAQARVRMGIAIAVLMAVMLGGVVYAVGSILADMRAGLGPWL